MGNNGFDEFDEFDNLDGFETNESFDNSSLDNDNDFDSSFFDDPTSKASVDSQEQDSMDNNFENFEQDDSSTQDESKGLKGVTKVAIIIIVVAVIAIVIAFFIQLKINKSSGNKDVQINSAYNTDNYVEQKNNQDDQNNMASNENDVTSNNSTTNEVDMNEVSRLLEGNVNVNDDSWKEIDDSSDIKYNDEYSELTYTVTELHNEARKINDNTIEVRTRLNGSISGLSGSFEVYVPYSKGTKLKIGNTFKVMVSLGEYNGNTVINDIKY